MRIWKMISLMLASGQLFGGTIMTNNKEVGKTLLAIADDIEKLKREYPQLKSFSPSRNLIPGPDRPALEYKFHTRQPLGQEAWRVRIPQPKEDGVWFYINIHNPDSLEPIDEGA